MVLAHAQKRPAGLRVAALAAVILAAYVWAGASAAPTSAATACGLAGSWAESTGDVGSSTWSITAAGSAQQQGLGNASGRAALSNGVLTIDWTTSDGYAGHSRWTLDASCKGTGTLTFTKVGPGDDRAGKSYPSTITGPPPIETASPRPFGSLTAKITAIEGEVAIRFNEGPWLPVTVGDKVGEDAELFTGVDSRLVVTFSDGSKFEQRQLTQLLVDTILRVENRKDVAIRLRVGELNAAVKKETVVDTNFEVQTPTATTSVRGTKFSVFHDAVGRATIVTVKEGIVAVDPVAPALATALVNPRQEVEVTATAITPLAATGKAGARGGTNRANALALVAAKLDRAARPCRLKTPRSSRAVSVKTAPGGWLVSVRVTGKARGTSTWTVKGGRASPKNAVAKLVGRRCR
jgi:FecR protein